MSGTSVAAKINKAMGKVGTKIGFLCAVYRPDNYAEPVDDRNRIIDAISVAWSVDDNFAKNLTDELDHYKVFVSSDLIYLGDIIVSDSVTLIITDIDPIRVPAGIRADDRLNIYRSQFVAGNDKKTQLNLIAYQVPAAIKIGKSSAVSLPNTSMKSGLTNIDVWTWMPADDLQISDVIEWRDNRFLVTSVNATNRGTKISATSTRAGK